MSLWKKLKKLPANLIIFLLRIYRLVLSPSNGVFRFLPFYPKNSCIFYPTCSEYAIICFQKYNFFPAFHKTIRRIGKCNTKNEPKIDLP